FFLFQAEDGIRDLTVTGVQTCALPIFSNLLAGGGSSSCRPGPQDCMRKNHRRRAKVADADRAPHKGSRSKMRIRTSSRVDRTLQIGRASCRQRVTIMVLACSL